jgi:argininosuccinate lyase
MFVVIGTTTVDLIVRGMPAFAGLGDGFRADNLVFCEEPLLMLMGGNGGNIAYVLGKLGVATAVCSSIGQDEWGDWLAQKLAAQGVNLAGLMRQSDLATSTSTILLDSAEKQAVFHHKGATDALTVTAVHETLFAQAELLLASSYTLLPQMRAGGFAQALQLTHEAGGITALDIGPAIGEVATTAEIAPLFPVLDYLIANIHEVMVCTGAADWETAAAALLAQGCRCLVVKRGAEGTALRSREFNLEVPAYPVLANISVGAGDSFNAGFLYGLWRERPLEASDSPEQVPAQKSELPGRQDLLKALRFGNVVAALVVGGQRGVFSAPTLAQVEEFLHE